MDNIRREFYEVYGASKLLGISVSDLWHLVEIGRLDASFRRLLANSTLHNGEDITIDDYVYAPHTFLIPPDAASLIAAYGSCTTDNASIQLAEAKEVSFLDREGEEQIGYRDNYNFELDSELLLNRDDVVITQFSIDKYLKIYVNITGLAKAKNEDIIKSLNVRTENNYLRLIFALANGIKGFNPKKPYEAAKLIIDETSINVSEDTIAGYIKKAYELTSKEQD